MRIAQAAVDASAEAEREKCEALVRAEEAEEEGRKAREETAALHQRIAEATAAQVRIGEEGMRMVSERNARRWCARRRPRRKDARRGRRQQLCSSVSRRPRQRRSGLVRRACGWCKLPSTRPRKLSERN